MSTSTEHRVEMSSFDLVQPLSIEEEVERKVKDFLCKEWSLPTPNLILSIIGDYLFDTQTSYFKREQFIEDLVSLLLQTNAWVFIDETNSSVNKLVVEAIQRIRFANDKQISSRITCIRLIKKESSTIIQHTIGHCVNMEASDTTSRDREVEINHCGVLQSNEPDTDETFCTIRRIIEENASKLNFNCPILQILTGGDRYCKRSVFQTIERGWPVLIISSDPESNQFDAATEITRHHRILYRNRTHRNRQIFDRCQTNFERNINLMEEIKTEKAYFLLEFYSIKSSPCSLYEIILQTMYNWANYEREENERYFKQMQIAITWNDTRRMISFDEIIGKFNSEYLCRVLMDAIFKNRVDFVEYLFKHGVSLEDTFRPTDMDKFWQITRMNTLPLQVQVTSGELSIPVRNRLYEDYQLDLIGQINSSQFSNSEVIRDLLLWSAFIDRPEMCKCLCSYTKEPIVAFLLVNKIYRKAKKRTYELPRRQEYMKKEKEFDRYAAELIDRCYKIDQKLAVDILQTPSEIFFAESPSSLAESNQSRAFLATKTMWHYLDELWYGKIKNQGHSKLFINFLIFISCLLVFLIPFPCVNEILSIQGDNCESSSRCCIKKIWHRYRKFYKDRVAVRFFYNIIVYIVFLGLYSYLLLAGYFPLNINGGTRNGYSNILIPVNETIVHILTWCFMIEELEEIRQYYRHKGKASKRRTFQVYYIRNKWKILDFITYLTYLIGFATRFVVIENFFIVSKIFMCINLFLWYVRILHLFLASEKLGPKLLMIFNTMVDLVFFICFIVIFLLAYCVTSYSLITTKSQVFWIPTNDGSLSRQYYLARGENNGTSLWSWNILRNALGWGMWKIYGEVNLINFEQADNSTISARSDSYGNIAFIFTIIFVCIANVLLLNVLVALFNATVQRVQEQALQSWPYHRFVLIKEYLRKSMLPPPFSLLGYIYRICNEIKERCSQAQAEDDSSDRISSFDVNRQSYIARKWREETWKVPSIATLANVYERDNSQRDSVTPAPLTLNEPISVREISANHDDLDSNASDRMSSLSNHHLRAASRRHCRVRNRSRLETMPSDTITHED